MEVDPPSAEQLADQPGVNLQLPLNILCTIKSAQLQNGLKHGDYARYRQYCARRLGSLYKAVKLLHGKGRYQKKKLDLQHVTDVRHLHIILMSAERCWSQAMQLKKESEGEGQSTTAPRKRHHALRRLRKAAVWAAELARFAAACCDTRSALEAEAYSSWMAGNVLMERETDWEKALATYSRSRKLFTELSRVGDPESQALCGAMVEELEPSLRYCQYQIERAGGAAPDPSKLTALAEGPEGSGGSLLQSKLASLAAEAQTAQAAATSSFEWRGLKAAVSLEKIRVPLHTAEEAAAALENAMDADGTPIEQVLLQHDKLTNLYSEARAAARAAAKAAAAGAAAGSSTGRGGNEAAEAVDVDELRLLDTALSGRILEVSLARAQAAAADAAARFQGALVRTAAAAAAQRGGGLRAAVPKGERPAKPEDLVRLYTTLSQLAVELEELSSHLGGKAGEALAAAAAARAAGYAAHRVYFAGHVALGAGDKWGEAAGLFRRAQERVAAAVEALQELPKSESSLLSGAGSLQELSAAAGAYLVVAAAEAAAEGAVGADSAAKGLQGLGLAAEAAAAAAAGQQQYLADNLDSWDSFAGVGERGKGARLYRGPYPLQPIAPRPIMLDSAGAEVDYPDITHRLAKKQKRAAAQTQGTFARLFGGWGS